jgi:hypothetical protein
MFFFDKFLFIPTDEYYTILFKGACVKGHLNIVKWLYNIKFIYMEKELIKGIDIACINGKMNIAEWLIYKHQVQNIQPFITNLYLTDLSIYQCNNVLLWLYYMKPTISLKTVEKSVHKIKCASGDRFVHAKINRNGDLSATWYQKNTYNYLIRIFDFIKPYANSISNPYIYLLFSNHHILEKLSPNTLYFISQYLGH